MSLSVLLSHKHKHNFAAKTNLISLFSASTVGRSTLCLLLVLYFVASKVNAEDLEELQIFDDAIAYTERVVEEGDKSIGKK